MEENINQKDTSGSKQIAGAIIIAGLLIAGAVLIKGGSGGVVGPDGKKLILNAKTFNACLDSGKYTKEVNDATALAKKSGIQSTPTLFILKDGKVLDVVNGAVPTEQIKKQIDDIISGKTTKVLPANIEPVSNTDFILGASTTGVTVVEYADFQCPFCGKLHMETGETLFKQYIAEGKINLVYRDFTFLGEESLRASHAARCANEQGKFWEYRDYLYTHQKGENQGNFSDIRLKSFAGELKLK